MRKYRTISSLFVLFLLWEIIAVQIHNDWLFPYPWDVLKRMVQFVTSMTFYEAVVMTLFRSLSGLLLAFLLASFCAFLTYRSKVFHDLFYPILLLTRSVPNISYIIIILVWFGPEISSSIVSFLIIFPTIYSSISSGLRHIDPKLKQVLQLYPERRYVQIRKVYVPLLQGPIQASLSAGIALAFKVGVMSEIIGQVQIGIGRQLNLCRLTTDTTGIFAWTGWIILILLLMECLLRSVYQGNDREA